MNIEEFKPYVPYVNNVVKEDCCLVYNKDGTQIVTMPDGTVIPRQVWSRVYTGVDQPPYVIVKIRVNLK